MVLLHLHSTYTAQRTNTIHRQYQTIVATAIPRITDEFGGIDLVGWYGSAFFITLGGFQAAWGKIYKYFPLKISFLISIVLFEIGSLICGRQITCLELFLFLTNPTAFHLGVAPNSLALIIGRAITGVGGAGISSGAFTIIAFSAPPKQRPAYIGILGASYGIAAAVGPLIGGAFTSHATWRWCFYINLPIGGVSGLIILLFYRSPPPSSLLNEDLKEKLLQMDLPGAFLLIGAMVCYCLALQWGGLSRPWNDSTVIGTLVGFVVLLALYVVVQWVQKERAAMVGRLFERNVILAMIYIDLLAGTFFLLVYYLPIYFQVVSGVSAAESGIRNLPLILAQSIATVLSGIALSKFQRPQPFLLFGAGITAVGSGLLYTLDIGSSSGKWIGFQILAGIGIGWCFQVPVVTAQSTAAPSDLPSVTGMVLSKLYHKPQLLTKLTSTAVQTLGGSVFVSAGQSALDNVLLNSLPNISGIDPKVVLETGSTELRQAFNSAQLSGILVAYMKGLKAAFLVAIIASSIATVVSMGVRRTKLAGSLPPTAV